MSMCATIYRKGKTMEKKIKRLNFDVPIELHKKIKTLAAENNISIKVWILRLILREIELIKSYKK